MTTHCGELEQVINRLWDPDTGLPGTEVATAARDLADLEPELAVRLAASIDELWLAERSIGYVCRSRRGAVARVLVLGQGMPRSASPARHLVAHALCDLDALDETPQWRAIARLCPTRPGGLPWSVVARDWWAESFARRDAGPLAELLGGDRKLVEIVMDYHRQVVRDYVIRLNFSGE
ncbi:hypothetical protein [Nonomuraea sp. NPDC046570]|uniref:hypothetical protein n=1 Tax=Nonomuraea sp. NPDC046570 TaxID=3155255 RepID=UPI0033D340B5